MTGAAAALLRHPQLGGHLTERRTAVRRAEADLAFGNRVAEANEHGVKAA